MLLKPEGQVTKDFRATGERLEEEREEAVSEEIRETAASISDSSELHTQCLPHLKESCLSKIQFKEAF